MAGIKANWQYGDNLSAFNEAIKSGLSPEEAALRTWTGKQASEAGFSKVGKVTLTGEPGSYTQVNVEFFKER